MADRIDSFPPIVDEHSKVLVLGTMPGVESLRQRRYYAFERNHFWSVIFALFDLEKPLDYESRIQFLQKKRIALWDVLESCVRPGSADADIKHPEPNRIVDLLDAHPGIGAVFLNGKGAEKLFRKMVLPCLNRSVTVTTLPSTSPAYAVGFEKKLQGWYPLLEYLASQSESDSNDNA